MSSITANITDVLYKNFYKIIYLILLAIFLFNMMNSEEKKPVKTNVDPLQQLVERNR